MYASMIMLVPAYWTNRKPSCRYRAPRWQTLAFPLLLVWTTVCGYALPRGPQPAVTIQLADIGFQGVPQALVEAGASMLTVHFVDNTHLLVTYGLRGLVERIPGDPPDDNDRAVGAVLVDLPT